MQFMANDRKRAGSMSSKQEGSDLNVDIQSKLLKTNRRVDEKAERKVKRKMYGKMDSVRDTLDRNVDRKGT